MRRNKLIILEQEHINDVLKKAEWGVLSINANNNMSLEYPHLVPLNFVHCDTKIYFHGALAGEKYELSKDDPKATFLVVEAYSQLPSYFSDEKLACPATQFFKSVILRGSLNLVVTDQEKALALQLLMEKLQPEGGYEPITEHSDLYKSKLKGVAVVCFIIEDVSAKFKFGQDQNKSIRENIRQKLTQRGCPIDLQTVHEMKRVELTS